MGCSSGTEAKPKDEQKPQQQQQPQQEKKTQPILKQEASEKLLVKDQSTTNVEGAAAADSNNMSEMQNSFKTNITIEMDSHHHSPQQQQLQSLPKLDPGKQYFGLFPDGLRRLVDVNNDISSSPSQQRQSAVGTLLSNMGVLFNGSDATSYDHLLTADALSKAGCDETLDQVALLDISNVDALTPEALSNLLSRCKNLRVLVGFPMPSGLEQLVQDDIPESVAAIVAFSRNPSMKRSLAAAVSALIKKQHPREAYGANFVTLADALEHGERVAAVPLLKADDVALYEFALKLFEQGDSAGTISHCRAWYSLGVALAAATATTQQQENNTSSTTNKMINKSPLDCMQEAVRVSGGDVSFAYCGLGKLLQQQDKATVIDGQKFDAKLAFRRALECDETNAASWAALASFPPDENGVIIDMSPADGGSPIHYTRADCLAKAIEYDPSPSFKTFNALGATMKRHEIVSIGGRGSWSKTKLFESAVRLSNFQDTVSLVNLALAMDVEDSVDCGLTDRRLSKRDVVLTILDDDVDEGRHSGAVPVATKKKLWAALADTISPFGEKVKVG